METACSRFVGMLACLGWDAAAPRIVVVVARGRFEASDRSHKLPLSTKLPSARYNLDDHKANAK